MFVKKTWTKEELLVVRQGWEAGDTPTVIAEKIPHRTPHTIAAAAQRYGYKRQDRFPVEMNSFDAMEKSMREQGDAFAAAMLKAGYTMTQSTPKLNSSGSTR